MMEHDEEDFYLSEDYSGENKIDKYRKKIQNRIRELLISEHDYMLQLIYLEEFFRKNQEIASAHESFSKSILKIGKIHVNFSRLLENSKGNLDFLAHVFINYENEFEIYLTYRMIYKVFQMNIMESKSTLPIQVLNYLSEPIKRIPLYSAMLAELLKYTQKYEDLAESETKVWSTAIQKALDSTRNILNKIQIAMQIGEIVECPFDIFAKGKLIRIDDFTVTFPCLDADTPVVCILFSNTFIITTREVIRPLEYPEKKVLYYFDSIELKELGITPPSGEGPPTSLTLWYRKRDGKQYVLKAEPDTMKDWLHEVQALLTEQLLRARDEIRNKIKKSVSMQGTGVQRKRSFSTSSLKTLSKRGFK